MLGPFDTWQVCAHAPEERLRLPQAPARHGARRGARPGRRRPGLRVVGDIGADVEAARGAGARSVLVPTPQTRAAEVRDAPCVAADLVDAVRDPAGCAAMSTPDPRGAARQRRRRPADRAGGASPRRRWRRGRPPGRAVRPGRRDPAALVHDILRLRPPLVRIRRSGNGSRAVETLVALLRERSYDQAVDLHLVPPEPAADGAAVPARQASVASRRAARTTPGRCWTSGPVGCPTEPPTTAAPRAVTR